jgi:hypothetical protein
MPPAVALAIVVGITALVVPIGLFLGRARLLLDISCQLAALCALLFAVSLVGDFSNRHGDFTGFVGFLIATLFPLATVFPMIMMPNRAKGVATKA